MKRLFTLVFIVTLGIFFSCKQEVVEIYVSTDGNDQSSGGKGDPVKSLDKAREIAIKDSGKKTIDILVEDGTYYLPNTLFLNAGFSGTEHHPITFKAVNEGQAIISGGEKLELKWKPFERGIFVASVTGDKTIDQLYVNGKRQRMARFPNTGEGKNVFDTWDLIHSAAPDPANDPLSPQRISRWNNPAGVYIHAMHSYLWGDMHWLVKGKNNNGSLNIEGGWQNNRPSSMHPRYRIVENVFEELDAPGEWYYNKQQEKLYYYPPEEINLEDAKIEIVRLKHLIEFNGSKGNPAKFITLDGFVFRHAARTFMENKDQLLRSDWTTYRGGAVFFDGAEDCIIENCEFDQLGGNSIFVNKYNRRIGVKSCYIHHSGANGVAFVGDSNTVRSPLFRYGKQDFEKIDRTPGPKGDNYPANCYVEDCLITMTGRDEKQTSPIQISMSYKIRISHCSIYDVPRAGININEGTFGGHTIEYCDVFNTVLETGDHGSFNSWGRDRFWTPDIRETAEEVAKYAELPKLDMLAPNIIRNSRWRCDHGWDIDLDDGSSWYRIYNNVLLNGGLKMREGYGRTATNNIIINNSLHPHVWYPKSGDVFKNNIVYGAYRPAVMNRGMDEDEKWGADLDSNLFVANENDRLKYAENGCDVNSIVGDPLFQDAQNMNYQVKENSPALRVGFKNFPMDQFGVVSEKLRKIAKTPKVPLPVSSDGGETGKIYDWYGAKVKDVETLGEQSASGLSAISGVLLIDVPENSELVKFNLKTGDVILECEGVDIKYFEQLISVLKNAKKKVAGLEIMHNQKKKTVRIEL
ncbi:MAG: hypothetical protein A2W90_06870 [Bacteroidetes bacterium GWF2_42_66]|nr:MAG: hypothetical protein A2W92_01790 [Bacteroidetes bacterium GWA2_42_15]OFY02925.1 MAG: hypothetical protein A2W89_24275 [Bacteroidetes bacterium GWE2_42_39]OFY44580.1 MAG: hypothetical protein A2W90_06870 [Bacteroidetes bacterium GWF2_42_66]